MFHVPIPWYRLPVFHLWHEAFGVADAAVPVVDVGGDVEGRVRRVGEEVRPAHGLAQPELGPGRVLLRETVD